MKREVSMRTVPYFINDERVDGEGDLLVFNPATVK